MLKCGLAQGSFIGKTNVSVFRPAVGPFSSQPVSAVWPSAGRANVQHTEDSGGQLPAESQAVGVVHYVEGLLTGASVEATCLDSLDRFLRQ